MAKVSKTSLLPPIWAWCLCCSLLIIVPLAVFIFVQLYDLQGWQGKFWNCTSSEVNACQNKSSEVSLEDEAGLRGVEGETVTVDLGRNVPTIASVQADEMPIEKYKECV